MMLIRPRIFSVFRTAARGMEAQRIALGASSENVANASTTRTEDGSSYATKRVVQRALGERPVRFNNLLSRMEREVRRTNGQHMDGLSLRRRLPDVELGPEAEVVEQLDVRLEYDPTHPHANAEGYVEYPDVNVVEEMARMMSANRIYEANLSAVQAAKEMIKRTLEI
ncbi:MAG: flagellar basal body rod protein FlgC [Rhodothermales bacterium]